MANPTWNCGAFSAHNGLGVLPGACWLKDLSGLCMLCDFGHVVVVFGLSDLMLCALCLCVGGFGSVCLCVRLFSVLSLARSEINRTYGVVPTFSTSS